MPKYLALAVQYCYTLLKSLTATKGQPVTIATLVRSQDLALVELVDALVQAIDLDRTEEVERLREALEPFGAVVLFNDELRLNGISSAECETCVCEGWL